MADPRNATNDDPAQDPAEGRRDDAYTEPEGQSDAQPESEGAQGGDPSQVDATLAQQEQ